MSTTDLTTEDRRRKRSTDPLIALHYQLTHARHAGSLETVVLADPSGVVVAGAGSWAACEELAAYAPLLADEGVGDGPVESRIAAMRADVDVRHLQISGQEVLLCGRGAPGGGARDLAMDAAALGISRILSAAA
ncbi:MAG: hypothetical protein ABIP39_13390 [Polyangiaceae bacterium]